MTTTTTNWSDDWNLEYHMNQWVSPKESTKAFAGFVKNEIISGSHYLDLGCGAGAATFSLATQFPESHWTGVDNDNKLISIGRDMLSNQNNNNLNLIASDMHDYSGEVQFDGVMTIQTLSWLPSYEETMSHIFSKLSPRFVALTSLFYLGDISVLSQVHEHRTGRNFFYNTYSIPQIEAFAIKYGYQLTDVRPFEIPIDLQYEDKNIDFMGTYTVQSRKNGNIRRLQISGPLLMNWYMLLFHNSNHLE